MRPRIFRPDTIPIMWLGAQGSFSPLQEFDIVDGRSDLLPGIFVSTSPITVLNDGALQGTPFTGDVFAAGPIDGRSVAVSAPATLALTVIGLVGGGLARRARQRRPRRRA